MCEMIFLIKIFKNEIEGVLEPKGPHCMVEITCTVL